MNSRTKSNLNRAMECAALASAKYCRFAARARMDENWDLAREFQQTAEIERMEHFATEADLEDLIEGSADNLRHTIQAEMEQIQLLKRFAEEARQDKELGVASLFEKISREKERRCSRFQRILENMGVHSMAQMVGG